MNRAGSMELEHSANVAHSACPHQENEAEGCTHDSSGLHVDVPSFAEATPERLYGGSAQQSLQSVTQDNVFSVFGDGKVDVIPPQNVEQEQPNFCIFEGLGSRFEDVYAEASLMMNLGEIKNFYMRRLKRLKQCSAPPEGSMQISDQTPFVAGETSDRTPTVEQANDTDTCLDNMSSNLEDKNLSLERKDPSSPSLDLSESNLLQLNHAKKATSQEKNTVRWARELMQLVESGPFNEEGTVMDIRDLSNTSRKRRRLQKINNSIGNESENLVMRERIATQNTLVLHKGAHRKWRDVDLSTTDPAQLVGCKCKVFWPEDKVWYTGVINGYNSEAGIHHVNYDDGDKEDLILTKELVKLYLSDADMTTQKLFEINELKKLDFQEMAALATVFEDFQEEFWHGELVWAKIKGICA